MNTEQQNELLAELIAVSHHLTILSLRTENGVGSKLRGFTNEEVYGPLRGLVPVITDLPENIQIMVKQIRKGKYGIV